MKKVVLALTLVLLVAFSVTAGDQDFVLENQTGLTIDQLYISSVDTNDWEEDVLGVDTLPDSESVSIGFSHKEDACMWDIKIVDEDSNEVIWNDINLCKTSKITLYFDEDDKPVAQIE
jgi:hypothetical protein